MAVTADHAIPNRSPLIAFLSRWLLTTNHKEIGTLYLWLSFTLFFIAGAMAMVIRLELFQPGIQFAEPLFYNQMVTMHGLIMVFGVVMPGFVGLANWLLPMMIGAPDMALPRLNNFSFWILPFAFTLLISTLFMEGGAPNFGWTFYAPLSTTYGPPSTDVFILGVHLMGISSVLGAINIIVTIFNLRVEGMTLMKMPLFVWTWLITAFLLVMVMPVLAGAVTMMLTDRHFDTSFFSAVGGGDPVLFQHVFWFFGHPEVYILILPGFGIASQIIPTFARKKLFGYHSMVYATVSIAILSFVVWGHHMFTTGMPLAAELFVMYATMLIAVPTGVKVFNWVATMWRGSMTFETPMLFAIGFVILFTIGGFSGLMLALDRGGSCYGVIYEVAPTAAATELDILFRRELMTSAYRPLWTRVHLHEGQVRRAITFVIDPNHDRYTHHLEEHTTVKLIAESKGSLGRCSDYLYDTLTALDDEGLSDKRLSKLAHLVHIHQKRNGIG